MSRLSRANLKGRESIFAGGPEQYRGDIQAVCSPNLIECVMALEDCCEEANEAQILLRNGTQDLPRMTRVLENQRVFLLVDEGIIKKYKGDLIDEVEPAINELMERAEHGLKGLLKKETQLKAKVEAMQNRPPAGTTMASRKNDQRRLQALNKQRERLQMEHDALEAEVRQLELNSTEENS